jgi:hypothetical protein
VKGNGPWWLAATALVAALIASPAGAQTSLVNFLPNGSFEMVEPPVPTPALKGQPAPADQWVPRTWGFWPLPWTFSGYALPDDPAQAHSGRRCVRVQTRGEVFAIQFGPIPHFDDRPWTVRFWARGRGQLQAVAYEFFHRDPPVRMGEWPFTLTNAWTQYEFQFTPPTNCTTWHLQLVNAGAAEYWVDDVFVGHPGLKPLGLPPEKALGRDEHTLFYQPFEEPLSEDTYFIKGKISLSNDGRFGKCLALGPEGYAACFGSDKINPKLGTIECWVRLNSPGNDNLTQLFIQVGGPYGLHFGKHQFPHIWFAFFDGGQAWAETYAVYWQPGVWRHVAACWDKDLLQVFVDGKLVAWEIKPKLLPAISSELGIGPAIMDIDDLRISNVVRYRVPLRTDGPRRNERFCGGKGKY